MNWSLLRYQATETSPGWNLHFLTWLKKESPPTSGRESPTPGSHWKPVWNLQLLWDTYTQGKATLHCNTNGGLEVRTICIFVPQVCKSILKEFQQEYLVCPADPEDLKKIEDRFKHRWNVCSWCTRWKTRCYQEAQEVRQWIFQLQGLLLPGTFGFSQCILQVPVGQRGVQWLIIWCSDIQPQQTEKKNWERNSGNTTTWVTRTWRGQICTTSCWGTMPLPWCLGLWSLTVDVNWPGRRE